MVRKIHVFCESFLIEVNHFIVKTKEYDLIFVAEEIEDCEFDFVLKYFNLSKLGGNHSVGNAQKVNNRNNIIKVVFPPLTSKVIENIRKIIPWAFIKFLEDLITNSVDYLFDKIKEGEYDFLGTYLDIIICCWNYFYLNYKN
ncbi:MAG TPA: hypothetical protein ENI29_21245 [bacterium]|nr:hypothetical protein [bacterium]